MIESLSHKAFINVDFPTFVSDYLQNLLYVPLIYYLFCKGSYIKSIDEIKRFLKFMLQMINSFTFAAETTRIEQ
jgi:hypothetical protein